MLRAGTQYNAGFQRQLLHIAINEPMREDITLDEREPIDEAEIEREAFGRQRIGSLMAMCSN